MNEPRGFYFYDLETTGRDPRWHRILQFAGVATDGELNPIGEPVVLRGALPEEILPEPEAMLVTQLTPDRVAQGLNEADLASEIQRSTGDVELCLAGYNSIRFDDEFLRFSFYRALLEPYQRERQRGLRWDLFDTIRAVHALRPDGIVWPVDETGASSLRLATLCAANGIRHDDAHDAASDVLATLGLARLVRERQPRLFAWAVGLRLRQNVEPLLAINGREPIVHVSGRVPRARRHAALVTPLASHPRNSRARLVFDLDQDPQLLATLDDAEIERRLFTYDADLDVERIRIKEVRTNRTPFVAPLAVLRAADAERLGIDVERACARHAWLRAHPDIGRRVARIFSRQREFQTVDADAGLYDGLVADDVLAQCAALRALSPEALAGASTTFSDARFNTLLARYRARNFPATLTTQQRADWQDWLHRRLGGWVPGALGVAEFITRIGQLRAAPTTSPADRSLLDAWATYGEGLAARVGVQ